MNNEKKEIKQQLKQKFLEFKLAGLKSYRQYLEKEFENAKEVSHKKAYFQYIEKEIKGNQKRLEKVSLKLKQIK